ncbi:hypothetical protein [Thalassotalea fusca]
MSLHTNKPFILFVILWIHVSVLDLFFVTYQGPVFLFAENTTLTAIITHMLIAAIGTGCYICSCQFRQWRQRKSGGVSDNIWLACSAMLIGAIIFIIV